MPAVAEISAGRAGFGCGPKQLLIEGHCLGNGVDHLLMLAAPARRAGIGFERDAGAARRGSSTDSLKSRPWVSWTNV